MEDNLQAVDSMLTNLRNMAVDMNAEITDQNEQLERITLKVRKIRGNKKQNLFFPPGNLQ